jgi:hypothetical protein
MGSRSYSQPTLSSIMGRILDNIILTRYSTLLVSSDLQFGFKRKRSTAMCSMVAKEVISHYTEHGSDVFCSFLDASKAFDKVHYCKLFSLLLNRQIPSLIIRVLLNIYTGQRVRVLWNGIYSECFAVSNGVKQGGIISPILFSIYFDEVLCQLQSAGVGCYIGKFFVGALAYADDLTLLAPTASAMRRMLAICERFADEFHVTFNVAKTKCVIFASRNSYCRSGAPIPVFKIANTAIENIQQWPHLGHVFAYDLSDRSDIAKRRNVFVGQVNNLLCQFSALDSFTLNKLFNSFCCSFYGCELWDLQAPALNDFCVAWRIALRRIWRLPRTSHSRLLPLIANCMPLLDCVCRRFIRFADSCVNSESPSCLSSLVTGSVLLGCPPSLVGIFISALSATVLRPKNY